MVQSRMSHHAAPTQADLDILNLLTSDSSALGPLSPAQKHAHTPSHEQAGQASARKQLPRRENPMDALLLTAVLNGSGPVSRHHLGHGSRQSRPSRPMPLLTWRQINQAHTRHATSLGRYRQPYSQW